MIADRKDDHVRHAVNHQRQATGSSDFDSVTFVHHALAGIDADEVSSRWISRESSGPHHCSSTR